MKHPHVHGLLLLACTSLLLCAAAVVPAAARGQREAGALLRWKASLSAGADEPLRSWSSSANSTAIPCNWAFLTCNPAGDVTKLIISNVSLNGTLAELDFPAFPDLETLVLDQNDLYGTIPEGIGNLTSLVNLAIMVNPRLTGPIPRTIGQLKQLALLELAYLGLHGTIPAEIGNVTSLEGLFLNGNSLTGSVPTTVGRLEKLTSLDLSNNQLEGHITEQLGNKSSLIDVAIASNNFSSMSAQSICARGGALLYVVADNNGFASPQDLNFQNCTSLRILGFAANNIFADIKEMLGMFPKQLEGIRLSQNQLYGTIPLELGEFGELGDLQLDENKITGEIPPILGNMTRLGYVNLGYNLLTGTIPPELGKPLRIYSLNLSYNHLSGPLPLTLWNLSKLVSLDLSNCSLTGQAYDILFPSQYNFPSNISWPAIQILVLPFNRITGMVPVLCKASYFKILDLSNNALYGNLPDCLFESPYLEFMDLSSNSFSGVVPISNTSKSFLQSLHLANNHFTGTFPSVLQNWNKLITLDLGGNSFHGEIPSWIGESFPQLRFLRLSSNMFDGIVPQQIFQLRHLQLLDLSHNKLKGPIPVDFTNLIGMTQEQLDGEILYFGGLHIEKIQLVWKNGAYNHSKTISFMAGIDLSSNSLSQWIPNGLTALRGIRYLNLSRNHLSGGIPEDIGNLVMLESLDLSWNQLSGDIPPSFADLKSMSTLNLSNNGLSGSIPTGSQLQTLTDPSIYRNNPGLCGFPLEECADATTSTQTEINQDDDREALWSYCFVVAGVIFGFWLSWGILFCNVRRRYAFCRYVDDMQQDFAEKIAAYHRSRARP